MKSLLAAATVLAFGLVGTCAADVVQLSSGETLRGKVLSLDEKQLKLRSQSLGELSLDRTKVDVIYFGDRPLPSAPATGQPAASPAPKSAAQSPKSPEEILEMLQAGPSSGTPQSAVDQLQKQGISKDTLSDLQKDFPLLMTPEVQGYFNDTLQGLMSGKLDIQNIRGDAIRARDAVDQLQKELGPQAAALNPYRSILDKFIRETTPAPDKKPAAASPGQTPPKK